MRFVSKLTPEQWAEARSLRGEGASHKSIAERFGIGPRTVASRARREGWPAPGGGAPVKPAAGKGRRPRASPETADVRRTLAGRLYHVLEIRIRMMELRMLKQLQALEKDEEPQADAADERETFLALIKNIEQVTELCSDTGGPKF